MTGSTVCHGRFEIGELIGEGGMGEVYRGVDSRSDGHVAIKFLRQELAGRQNLRDRALQEAKVQMRLRGHPNILGVIDYDEEHHALVMDYVEGSSLRELIDSEAPLPLDRCVQLFNPLLDAVGFAHRSNVVHRDIKPDNVLLDRSVGLEVVKLTDFGVAHVEERTGKRMTQVGEQIGTADYMAPEQILGLQDVDHRVDIYALGVLLFELLSGRCPFEYDGSGSDYEYDRAVKEGHLGGAIPRLTERVAALPPAIDEVISTALAKKPEGRFESAADFRDALLAVSAGAPQGLAAAPAAQHESPPPPSKPRRRPPDTQPEGLPADAGTLAPLAATVTGIPDGPSLTPPPEAPTVQSGRGTMFAAVGLLAALGAGLGIFWANNPPDGEENTVDGGGLPAESMPPVSAELPSSLPWHTELDCLARRSNKQRVADLFGSVGPAELAKVIPNCLPLRDNGTRRTPSEPISHSGIAGMESYDVGMPKYPYLNKKGRTVYGHPSIAFRFVDGQLFEIDLSYRKLAGPMSLAAALETAWGAPSHSGLDHRRRERAEWVLSDGLWVEHRYLDFGQQRRECSSSGKGIYQAVMLSGQRPRQAVSADLKSRRRADAQYFRGWELKNCKSTKVGGDRKIAILRQAEEAFQQCEDAPSHVAMCRIGKVESWRRADPDTWPSRAGAAESLLLTGRAAARGVRQQIRISDHLASMFFGVASTHAKELQGMNAWQVHQEIEMAVSDACTKAVRYAREAVALVPESAPRARQAKQSKWAKKVAKMSSGSSSVCPYVDFQIGHP